MGEKVDRLQVALAKVVVGPSVQNRGGKLVKISGYEYLGDDGAGNQIRVGSSAEVIAGPDKGLSGTVQGLAKGGGIQVKVGTGVQSRSVLADPDEIRVSGRNRPPPPPSGGGPKASKLAQFEKVFRTELDRSIREHPGEYEGMTSKSVPGTVARIMPSIAIGKVNKDTPAMRATFKKLGIPHTYKALKAWFDDEGK